MLFVISCKSPERIDYTVYVNPFIGSEGTGHIFPARRRRWSFDLPQTYSWIIY